MSTKSHMRYIPYALNCICDISHMHFGEHVKTCPFIKKHCINIAYAIYWRCVILHMRYVLYTKCWVA